MEPARPGRFGCQEEFAAAPGAGARAARVVARAAPLALLPGAGGLACDACGAGGPACAAPGADGLACDACVAGGPACVLWPGGLAGCLWGAPHWRARGGCGELRAEDGKTP